MRTFIFRTSDLEKARKDEDFCIADVDFKMICSLKTLQKLE
jgi:hypothetical protein